MKEHNEAFTICKKTGKLHQKTSSKNKIRNSLVVFIVLNLLWLIFRTGTKPSRIVYPCQQTALKNIGLALGSLIPMISISVFFLDKKEWKNHLKKLILVLLIFTPISSGLLLQQVSSGSEVALLINPVETNDLYSTDIFVVNGREVSHIEDLINLMGSNGLLFYQSENAGLNQGPTGLISDDDVTLIKINCQWSERGGTNTDTLKELVEAIISHPDGFKGEIIVADNGQGRGSMDWSQTNAEDKKQSTQDVVNLFSSTYNVSTYLWDEISSSNVDEFSTGDMDDGYFVYDTADIETEIIPSYPKFTTPFGTKVSFKYGIWNGTSYEQKLKVINMPVLKSHSSYGVTATLKHYMGVQTQSLANGHDTIDTGGMGTLMVEFGVPTLNIIDAIWINANPETSRFVGPGTSYSVATRTNILIAGLDSVALDYWSAKHILMPVAELIGYTDTYSLDPSSSKSTGLTEAFGIWLNNTKAELIRGGYNVTTNEQKINVHANSLVLDIEVVKNHHLWMWFGISGSIIVLVSIITVVSIKIVKKRRNKINEVHLDKS
ncbi:MAG TPA: DUF362 domain-containing protein [Candidatus Bathyarchaeia archaeon]|nr:DUF362 domain-containing protein [Candidatus Bathyarchaeia archaeon]